MPALGGAGAGDDGEVDIATGGPVVSLASFRWPLDCGEAIPRDVTRALTARGRELGMTPLALREQLTREYHAGATP